MSGPAWLVAAGLTAAASAHCAGMCGGFVLGVALRDRGKRLRFAGNQALLHLGKATTYAFLGALAGLFGGAVIHSRWLAASEQVLALAAAVLLAFAGLTLLGLRRSRPGAWVTRLATFGKQILEPLLAERPAGSSLVIGMVLGFLPCPLVYAGLAAAAAAGSAAQGAVLLAGVALGSLPALAAVATVGVGLTPAVRLRLARAGGVLLIVLAGVTAVRAFGHEGHGLHGTHDAAAPSGHAAGSHCAP